jgi:hypothetical protein
MADAWKESLKRQLASRNTLQGTYFQELLRVHGATAADERQFRRRALRAEPAAAEAAPLREQHNAALLHNAELQRRLQELEERAAALQAENGALREKLMESKVRDAEALNELTGNLEFYRQQESAAAAGAAAGDSDAGGGAAPPPVVAPPAHGGAVAAAVEGRGDGGQGGGAQKEKEEMEAVDELPPVVGIVEIVETGSGHDEYTGLEFTTYKMRCRAAAATASSGLGADEEGIPVSEGVEATPERSHGGSSSTAEGAGGGGSEPPPATIPVMASPSVAPHSVADTDAPAGSSSSSWLLVGARCF